jgi:hypothetical protein
MIVQIEWFPEEWELSVAKGIAGKIRTPLPYFLAGCWFQSPANRHFFQVIVIRDLRHGDGVHLQGDHSSVADAYARTLRLFETMLVEASSQDRLTDVDTYLDAAGRQITKFWLNCEQRVRLLGLSFKPGRGIFTLTEGQETVIRTA